MGDNRDRSLDSRQFGPVRRERIVGRATAVAASLDPDRHFLPRWQRFFRELR
jgi:signal peptidase I